MTKPKNPYKLQPTRTVWDQGYAAGLRDREKLLARALRRWSDAQFQKPTGRQIEDWLTARAKRGKGR
jgi:hypothetical protein